MLPDKASFDQYGGPKADYAPPEDVTTDRAAAEVNEALADVAATTRMVGRAYVTFTWDGTNTAVVEHDAVWGNGNTPEIGRAGAGDYSVRWPSTVFDALGVAHAVNIRRGLADIDDVTWRAQATRLGPDSVRVQLYDIHHGVLGDLPGIPITVLVW